MIDPPPDRTVVIATPGMVAAGAGTHSVAVDYEANVAGVKLGSIDASDVTVTGPGGTTLAVVAVNAPPDSGIPTTHVRATYTLAAPGGNFNAGNAGSYTVSVAAGAVTDLQGRPLPAASASFDAPLAPADTAPPAASVQVWAVPYTADPTSIQVYYGDNTEIDLTSIDPGDFTVTGPGGTVAVSGVTRQFDGSGAFATYVIEPPGGAWDVADNGIYTVTVPAGAVMDTSGNPVATKIQLFEVAIGPIAAGPDLVAEMLPNPMGSASVLPGAAGVARVKVTNRGTGPLNGPVSVRLAATDHTPSFGRGGPLLSTQQLAVTPPRVMRLDPGQSRVVSVRFHYPQAASTYNLAATVDPDNKVRESLELNNDAVALETTLVAPALTAVEPGGVGAPAGGMIRRGKLIVVPVTLRNNGNVPYRGPVAIDVFAAASAVQGPFVRLGAEPVRKRVALGPNRSMVVRVAVPVPVDLPPGQYGFKVDVTAPPGAATDLVNLTRTFFGAGGYLVV